MKPILPLLAAFGVAASVALAQSKGGPPAPPLMECGVHGDIEILCGTRSPEDLELTPDGKYLIVSQMVSTRGANGKTAPGPEAGLVLFDIAAKKFSKLSITEGRDTKWGDPACPGFIADRMIPHGISLSKRNSGAMQLYVVNHGARESIEMFELKQSGGSWSLIWRGCAVSIRDFNDVAALPDGSFIATHPTALRSQGDTSDLFAGSPSGYVSQWSPVKEEGELPGTHAGYPNGVLAGADGRHMYFNAWTAKEVHKYDLRQSKDVGVVKLDFMPDNITWTANGHMLAAGVKSARGECPSGSGTPCIQAFEVADIDPANMTAQSVFDSQGKGGLISGVSVALQVGNSIYIGAFQGDRLVKIRSK
ncbi:MAG: SMP-30/gluconolactonase/LRE family protein [Bryobacterales bacterium]|nr:SMP-30/gluconolactonase/LRE family protein [Bryobacterales bacterium]